jgi:hypothetical protein
MLPAFVAQPEFDPRGFGHTVCPGLVVTPGVLDVLDGEAARGMTG